MPSLSLSLSLYPTDLFILWLDLAWIIDYIFDMTGETFSYFVFPLLIKLYIIHYTLLYCVLPLYIKCQYLLSFLLTLNILISTSATSSSLRYYYYCLYHYHFNKQASWEREQEWCHAIFFFFFNEFCLLKW